MTLIKKIVFISIIIILLILVVTGVVYTISKNKKSAWRSYQENVTSGVMPAAGQILQTTLTYNETASSLLVIDNVQVKNGYAPKYEDKHEKYTFVLLDGNGKNLKEIPLIVPIDIADDPSQPQSIQPLQFIITTDWLSTAKKIQVINLQGDIIASKSLEDIEIINNTPDFQSIPGNELHPSLDVTHIRTLADISQIWNTFFSVNQGAMAAGSVLNITLIGDKYPNLATFQNDAAEFANEFLSVEPFHSRRSQILFNIVTNINSLGCNLATNQSFPSCNLATVMDRVNSAGVPSDKVAVIIYNDGSFGNASSTGLSNFSTQCCARVINKSSGIGMRVFVHELGGHLLGGLIDEYQVSSTPGTITNTPQFNCYAGTPPASQWQNTVAIGDYTLRCNRPNWYRAAEKSIMDDPVDNMFFTAPAQQLINQKIDIFAGAFINTTNPTATITTPSSGATVSGIVPITTSLSDDLGIARAELWVDNVLYHTEYVSPFNFSWDSSGAAVTSHTLTIKAYDVSNSNNSAEISVPVNVGKASALNLNVSVDRGKKEGSNQLSLQPGEYTITEQNTAQWNFSSASCKTADNKIVGTLGANGVGKVTFTPGQTITCMFINSPTAGAQLCPICPAPPHCDDTSQPITPTNPDEKEPLRQPDKKLFYSTPLRAVLAAAIATPGSSPTILNVFPSNTTEGNPTLSITLYGTNFTSQSIVLFGEQPKPTQYISSTELKATIPSSAFTTSREESITVTNNGNAPSNSVNFTIYSKNCTPCPVFPACTGNGQNDGSADEKEPLRQEDKSP